MDPSWFSFTASAKTRPNGAPKWYLAKLLVEGIAGARLEGIPGTGHLINLEQPIVYDDIVPSCMSSKPFSAPGGTV